MRWTNALLCSLSLGLAACATEAGDEEGSTSESSDASTSAESAETSSSDTSEATSTSTGDGDGDGDATSGDGDGDGDGTSGDGDGDGDATSGDGDGDGDGTSGDGDGDGSPDVPPGTHCEPVAQWDAAWVAWELELLQRTNEIRAAGNVDCGQYGIYGAAGPLTMQPQLRCAARLHSKDMNERQFFSHGTWPLPGANPTTCVDGNDCGQGELCDDQLGQGGPRYCLEGPSIRLDDVGYSGGGWGENILWGYGTAEAAFNGWVDSDGHCRNLMNPDHTEIGMGYADAPGTSVRRAATMLLGGG